MALLVFVCYKYKCVVKVVLHHILIYIAWEDLLYIYLVCMMLSILVCYYINNYQF